VSDSAPLALVPGREILGKRAGLDRGYRVKKYDFKRPDKFSREQIRTVEIVHESFARLAGVGLSSLLHLPCEFNVALVDQLTFGEFMETLSAPAVLCAFDVPPWEGRVLFHLDMDFREALLERGFGGSVGPVDPALSSRDLTDLEAIAIEILAGPLLASFGTAWEQVDRLAPAFRALETDPRFCQIVPPTEMILLVGLDVAIGGRKARLHIVIPYISVEPVVHKLSAEYWYSLARPDSEGAISTQVARGIDAPAKLLVEGGKLSVSELRSLKKGSLIPIPGLDEGVGRLRAGGLETLRFSLPSGLRGGRFTLRVIDGEGDRASFPDDSPETALGRRLEEGLSAVGKGLAALREGLAGSLGMLGTRLAHVEARQEGLADRLAFGGADESEAGRPRGESGSFTSLSGAKAEALADFLASERAQASALVLARLDDALAARVLDEFPSAYRMDVVRRLASLGPVLPSLAREFECVLAKKLEASGREAPVSGGLSKIVSMLNMTRRETEKSVIEGLDLVDPALSEEIKRLLFVFEDISLLDAQSIALLLGKVEEDDIALGLKPLDASTRSKVLSRLDPHAAGGILARVEALGRVRLSECDAASQRVIAAVRALELQGLIGFDFPGMDQYPGATGRL
jgi:flagellar motor switch protein FliM